MGVCNDMLRELNAALSKNRLEKDSSSLVQLAKKYPEDLLVMFAVYRSIQDWNVILQHFKEIFLPVAECFEKRKRSKQEQLFLKHYYALSCLLFQEINDFQTAEVYALKSIEAELLLKEQQCASSAVACKVPEMTLEDIVILPHSNPTLHHSIFHLLCGLGKTQLAYKYLFKTAKDFDNCDRFMKSHFEFHVCLAVVDTLFVPRCKLQPTTEEDRCAAKQIMQTVEERLVVNTKKHGEWRDDVRVFVACIHVLWRAEILYESCHEYLSPWLSLQQLKLLELFKHLPIKPGDSLLIDLHLVYFYASLLSAATYAQSQDVSSPSKTQIPFLEIGTALNKILEHYKQEECKSSTYLCEAVLQASSAAGGGKEEAIASAKRAIDAFKLYFQEKRQNFCLKGLPGSTAQREIFLLCYCRLLSIAGDVEELCCVVQRMKESKVSTQTASYIKCLFTCLTPTLNKSHQH